MTTKQSDKLHKIEYVDSEHWGPELPRIIDPAGNKLAICDDIDAADIILQALNTRASVEVTGIWIDCENKHDPIEFKARSLEEAERIGDALDFMATISIKERV